MLFPASVEECFTMAGDAFDLAERFQTLVFVMSDLDLGIGIDFSDPRGIGADRLANAVGVLARYGSPAIVVDFGTAVTFDIISGKGVYEGGVIAPGLGGMVDYM